MEMKWIAICVIGFVTAMFTPVVVDKYNQGQCKMSFATSDKTADEIIKICK